MRNIIDAIIEVVQSSSKEVKEVLSSSTNRANQMGDALEKYVIDIFAGTVDERDENKRIKVVADTFCYLGNNSNPPDSMIKNGGAAIEVKKIEAIGSTLPLNSSYPKVTLSSNSPMITNACKECEPWSIRDMLYVVGYVDRVSIKSLALVYGCDYCAEQETYQRIKQTIKDGVGSIPSVEFAETKEIGRVNRVDPLGITYLRIRGMWHIENPFKVFSYVYTPDEAKQFNMMALINEEKLSTLSNFPTLEQMVGNCQGLKISDVRIKNPNNPAQLRNAKLITYSI